MIHIVLHTFKVLIREKIIFNVFGITILLLFFDYLASQLVYGHQDRVMLDLGLMMNALSIISVSIAIGSRFFRQDIESKTIYLFLTRPISRTNYYLGRFLGMAMFLCVNFLFLVLVLWGSVILMQGKISLAFFQSSFLTFLEALILVAGSLMFSFWLRPALVSMVMLTIVFLGHNHQLIDSLQSGISILNKLTPNLSVLLMSDRVYYEQALTSAEFIYGAVYGFFWLGFFLLLGNVVFSRKNL